MAALGVVNQYFVYANRLSSFQAPQPIAKKRTSNASSRAPKALTWPHKFLPPFELAKAGFYYEPHPNHPDNVVCFMCHKHLDGWEPDDSPVAEHIKHSPQCGWAVTAAVEAEYDGWEQVDPRDSRLVEARMATFAGSWPYETKKGWKCKIKQLAEAGWIYTPTNESDDNTTCAYCQLALDGWEAGDKPIEEHHRRSPNCPFFEVINSNPAPPKKSARGKAVRASKASRISLQSVATAVSDITAVTDDLADQEDSVMTTASIMTQSSKKTTKGRKAPAASKARKIRTKKEEPVEIHEDVEPEDEEMPPPSPPKPARGRKRGSDAVEDSVLTNAEAPAPKKRAARTRASQNPDASTLTTASQVESIMEEAPVAQPKAAGGRKRAAPAPSAKTVRSRKASAASVASTASTASMRRTKVPADEELERQLQADMERPLTDDEDLAADSDSERRNAPPPVQVAPKAKSKKATSKKTAAPQVSEVRSEDYVMFDPAPAQPDDAAVEAEHHELDDELAAEMEVEIEAEPQLAVRESDLSSSAQFVAEVDVFHDASEVHDSSTATVVKKDVPPKRGRGRPKKSTSSRVSTESLRSRPSEYVAPEHESEREPEQAPLRTHASKIRESTSARASAARASAAAVASPQRQRPLLEHPVLPPPSTPSSKQPGLSPSQSPQSSDAENQPPSSKPTAGAVVKRVVLASPASGSPHKSRNGVASTPVRAGSPSKRQQGGNPRVLGGLQSSRPWTEIDLDLVFDNHDKLIGEGPHGDTNAVVARFLDNGGSLATPERQMTVEEWIYHNAGRAEEKLKQECEALVNSFEKEGTKAMRVLEELVVD